jgi:phospholipid/cholesterol/gamma-HCH transport system substrate-binding protein
MRSRIVREGSIGLFALLGLILLGGLVIWLRGGRINQESYQIIVNFADVSGLQLGAPVNYRGVRVGQIVALTPGSNNVRVTLQIDSAELRIPKDVTIEANRYGLIGEASVDITPKVTLSEQALQINPNSQECREKQKILCNKTELDGISGSQLVSSLTRLSQAYSDPQLLANLNATTANAAIAGAKIAKLSDEMTLVAKTTRQEIQGVSETLASIQGVANKTTNLVENIDKTVINSQTDLQKTVKEASTLMENLNLVVLENRNHIERTILSVEKTSNDLQKLAQNLDVAVSQINEGLAAADTPAMAQNLERILADTAQTSANLRQLSDTLNDPANVVTIMKTLDAARVTFENTQKITSDIEELIGDPVLRENLRKMINGLSDLVSSTQQLEQQMITLQQLQNHSTTLKSFTESTKSVPINPQTTRYQILEPERIQNRQFLTQKKEE